MTSSTAYKLYEFQRILTEARYLASTSSKDRDTLTSPYSDDRWRGDSSGSPPSLFDSLSPVLSPRVHGGAIPRDSDVLQGTIGYSSHMPDASFGPWYSNALDVPWDSSLYVFYLVWFY
jgi:hypothetical protein